MSLCPHYINLIEFYLSHCWRRWSPCCMQCLGNVIKFELCFFSTLWKRTKNSKRYSTCYTWIWHFLKSTNSLGAFFLERIEWFPRLSWRTGISKWLKPMFSEIHTGISSRCTKKGRKLTFKIANNILDKIKCLRPSTTCIIEYYYRTFVGQSYTTQLIKCGTAMQSTFNFDGWIWFLIKSNIVWGCLFQIT